jgi:Domain of unknown function (DUF4388)
VALKGTLKDFGIAEILQLIGQQAKSGVLHLESRDDKIHLAIAEGHVVRAESAGREAREKLGSMLVRAEVITQTQLDAALEVQKRTLRRLGDILVELGDVSVADLREMTALQTTETVYKLFHWKSGTYAFEASEVEWDPETVTPLRAESVLMEGYRQVDEWPLVRKKITSSAMTFERLKGLEPEPPPPATKDDVDAAFDGLGEPAPDRSELVLGRAERRVYDLALPDRPLERIIDLSRLGEFETSKALLNLVNLGYLKATEPSRARSAAVGAYARDWRNRVKAGLVRTAATLVIAALLAGLAAWVDERGRTESRVGVLLGDNAVQRLLGRYQLARLRGALEVYRLENGAFPERLDALVEAGLASPRDLRYPFSQPYHYRVRPEGRFVLLPPVQ